MVISFINSFQSEWLKKKRSAAWWLTVLGAFFIPTIFIVGRITHFDELYRENTSPEFWEMAFLRTWQPMAVFFLPFGVIIATSLVTQIEFKNNTWKQLHATPQSLSVIFFSKLLVILTLLLQFFILFNIGIYLIGIVPAIIFRGIPFPVAEIQYFVFLKMNIKYFICCLPIVAIQYLVSLQFKNVLVPIGFGIAMFVATMIGLNWEYRYALPYIYSALNFMRSVNNQQVQENIYLLSISYFVFFTLLSYILYITKREKG